MTPYLLSASTTLVFAYLAWAELAAEREARRCDPVREPPSPTPALIVLGACVVIANLLAWLPINF